MNRLLSRLADSTSNPRRGTLRTDMGLSAAAFVFAAVLASTVEEFTAFEWSLWPIQIILALSLTLVWGFGGIFSLGQAAIYGIGGYGYGFWAINLSDNTGETLTAVVAAVLLGSLFAAVLGYFMFYGNVTDVYVAIITLATSLVLFAFVNSTSGSSYRIGDAPFGGYNGMTQIPRLTWRLPGGDSHQLTRVQFFIVCVAVSLIVAVIIRVVARRPFGRIAVAVQGNELRTELLGYDVRWQKLAVFVMGGAIASLAGALFASWGRFISPPVFGLAPAALVVIWVLVGGRTSVVGAFLGVLVVEGLSSWFGGASGDNEPIVLGAILIAIVVFLPGGIVTNVNKVVTRAIASRSTDQPGAAQLVAGVTSETIATSKGELAPAPTHTRPRETRISAAGVTKRFGGLTAVENVNVEFPSRGVSCLIGPNGAGKSTFFGLLSGRLTVSEGSVRLDDMDLTNKHPYRRAREGLGIKLQVASIYQELTTRENLWIACYSVPRDTGAADERAAELLGWLGLAENADVAAGNLSHGEQQWLEIGMVVATEPSVVLLDEPTAGMSRAETERTGALVKQLGANATVVVVEHDMEFVKQLNAPITVLHMGKLFAQGSFEELSSDQRIIDIYLGRESADAATD